MKQLIFNIIVGFISILALIFSLFKLALFAITSDPYIGIIVSTLSIATTLVIGYQIYNVIEIRRELKQFDKKVQQQNFQYKRILKNNFELESKLQFLIPRRI